ncbi:MAG: AmmeMemoRadiSam system protein A [Candidatus Riflebacteria bacterium]|nr:AmmeMemoRadiSam system protein A [Candidatus Riflebacteria bacterium]
MTANVLKAFAVPHPPVILHEVGQGREKDIQKTIDAYEQVAKEISEAKPDVIIIISPHATMFSDYFHISPGKGARGDFSRFGARQVQFSVSYDEELAKTIDAVCRKASFPGGIAGEREPTLDHGTTVPLYFIDKYCKDYKIIRIGLSGLDLHEHYKFGELIAKSLKQLNRKAVVVASGDLSHCLKEDGPYGYKAEGPKYDKKVMEVLSSGALDKLKEFDEMFCMQASECGHRSFVIMSGIIGNKKVSARELSYEGPFGVGYGVFAFEPEQAVETEDEYIRLARMTIETYIKERRIIKIPAFVTQEMKEQKAGVFVSLHLNGNLRGCIGTIAATTESVAEEIIGNAISASTRDPRFEPVMASELVNLEVKVDVLKAAEAVGSLKELDVKRYGVIVTKGRRRGLLLPNLEGVDTVEDQVSIAKQKAGIDIFDSDVVLERFEVIRHEVKD